MTYPLKHQHVSQLRQTPNGFTGENDCAEASMTRWLREADFPWQGDDLSLVGHVRERMTGVAEYTGQPYTSVAQVTGYMEAAGIPYRVNTDPHAILQPWTIALVHGVRLRPAQYPPSWFDNIDAPDHFILQLPDSLTNDPLAFNNGQKDCTYAQDSLVSAMQGGIAYHLPDPSTIVWHGTVASIAPPQKLAGYVFKTAQMLRPTPSVLPKTGPLVAVGTHVGVGPPQSPWGTGTTNWARVLLPDGKTAGWAYRNNVEPVYK